MTDDATLLDSSKKRLEVPAKADFFQGHMPNADYYPILVQIVFAASIGMEDQDASHI